MSDEESLIGRGGSRPNSTKGTKAYSARKQQSTDARRAILQKNKAVLASSKITAGDNREKSCSYQQHAASLPHAA